MDIEWDEQKAATNESKHGVTFQQAAELLLSDRPLLEFFDDAYASGEERYIAIGEIDVGILTVVYAEYEYDRIRIVSARHATERERRTYQRYRDDTP